MNQSVARLLNTKNSSEKLQKPISITILSILKTDAMNTANSIDDYILSFPKAVQTLLQQVRNTIQKAAPKATEAMKYGIPTFVLNGNLVHFGGYKTHIGFYPGAAGVVAFQEDITQYHSSKGAIQFPIDKPIPHALIRKIVLYRVNQNEEKAAQKGKKKTCENGHTFIKSSDCPTCPICEQNRKPASEWMNILSAPARRALENEKITTLAKLAKYKSADILKLHGMGPASIPKLTKVLSDAGLAFKK